MRYGPRADGGGRMPRPMPRGRVWVPRAALWLAAMAVLAGVALVQLGDSGVPAWRQLRVQDAQLSREVAELTRRNAELREELKALQNDPETLERLARENAGMQRPGEEVLRVWQPAEDGRAR